MAILAVEKLLQGGRVLYCSPTQDQIQAFWTSCNRYLEEPIATGLYSRNLTRHSIEKLGTDARIKAKTAWDPDSLRGDWAHLLIMDEYQLVSEDTFNAVGAPMLADHNGDAVFIYTPPSLRNRNRSIAKDPQHAAKLFKKAQADASGRWATFTFTSMENPYISQQALSELSSDMSAIAFRQEIMAEDVEEAPGALWNRQQLDRLRVTQAPELVRIITSVDPSATSSGDEAGIVTVGLGRDGHMYVIADDSLQGSPAQWSHEAVAAYHRHKAGRLVAEKNQGGEMIRSVISMIPNAPPVKLIHAADSKQARADPVAVVYEQGKAHHVGTFPRLEDELCLWQPGGASPNRLDAMVQACTELLPNLKHMPNVDYRKSGLQAPPSIQYIQPTHPRVTLR
jgi:phage terminase large subunit-like protein